MEKSSVFSVKWLLECITIFVLENMPCKLTSTGRNEISLTHITYYAIGQD